MIDIENAKNEFLKYANNFDLNNINIEIKLKHSLRVKETSTKIAQGLKLSEEQIKLATLIGLLHDIGRFHQYQNIGLGDDLENFDHGDYAIDILNKDIRKYIDTDKYDKTIKKAIKNHNKLYIENGLSEEELLFSKIVRDSDKLDILYEGVTLFFENKEKEIALERISDEVMKEFCNNHLISNQIKQNNLDYIIGMISYIYDINYLESFKILNKENYINKILDRFQYVDKKTEEKINQIREIANKYIENKIKG